MLSKQELLDLYNMDLDVLLNESKKYLKDEVEFCSIINARSGKCSQNCRYCAQSSHYNTDIESFPLIDVETVVKAAHDSVNNGANRVAIDFFSSQFANSNSVILKNIAGNNQVGQIVGC